jgi:hypothetical protein
MDLVRNILGQRVVEPKTLINRSMYRNLVRPASPGGLQYQAKRSGVLLNI